MQGDQWHPEWAKNSAELETLRNKYNGNPPKQIVENKGTEQKPIPTSDLEPAIELPDGRVVVGNGARHEHLISSLPDNLQVEAISAGDKSHVFVRKDGNPFPNGKMTANREEAGQFTGLNKRMNSEDLPDYKKKLGVKKLTYRFLKATKEQPESAKEPPTAGTAQKTAPAAVETTAAPAQEGVKEPWMTTKKEYADNLTQGFIDNRMRL